MLFTELNKPDYKIYKSKDLKMDERLLKKKMTGLPYQILALILQQQELTWNWTGQTHQQNRIESPEEKPPKCGISQRIPFKIMKEDGLVNMNSR